MGSVIPNCLKPGRQRLRHLSMSLSWSGLRGVVIPLFLCSLPAFSQALADRYTLILQDAPVSARFAHRDQMASPAALVYRQQIETAQAAVRGELASRHVQVTSASSLLINAVFVSAPGHTADELGAIPGVAAVVPMRKFKSLLNRAVALMNGPAAWASVGGSSNAGKGIKIGVLDSGIELTNPAFQDSSLSTPSGFPKCTSGHSEDCAFTNSKVIVARSYVRLLAAGSNPTNPAVDSQPDDYSPRDRWGHGSGIAMAAAGNAISTPALSTAGSAIAIQGMAPKAWIGNYKIAGTFGFATDESMIQAVTDAVSDGMDVITTSWGSIATADALSDPVAQAFEKAAQAGPVVVAAAGNDGGDGNYYGYQYPNFSTISSPSNAADVISVGASLNSHYMTPSVSVNAAGAPASLKNIPATAGDSTFVPSNFGANSAPLLDVSTVDSTGLACGGLPAGSLSGAYALILRGTCPFDTKAANAQAAGAIGFIFYMADSSALIGVSDSNETGPTAMISNASGLALKSYLASNRGAVVTIDLAGLETDLSVLNQSLISQGYSTVAPNMVASFSSFGPTPDGLIKPDLVATGGLDSNLGASGGVYTVTQTYDSEGAFYSTNGFMAADGTSIAAPLVAGAAALVKQAHASQNLRGTQIRSLLVNSTAQTVTMDDFGDAVDVEWIGAGMLDAGAAVQGVVTAEPATASFGILKSGGLPKSVNITLTNISSTSQTLAGSVSCCLVNGSSGTLTGATVAINSTNITLASGATATLTATLSGTVPAAGEYSGQIVLKGTTSSLHIPFMLLVGSGTGYNVTPIGISPESISLEGVPGQDLGPGYPMLQVVDQFGVPVANSPVTFSVSPRGSVTLKSSTVSGAPPCTPATSTTTTSCTTDKFGNVWVDVVLGSSIGTPTISFNASGTQDYFYVNIQPAPAISAGGVADAVSGKTPIVPGSYVSIYGTGLADAQDTFSTQCPGGPCVVPLTFDGVSVSFDVPSAGISAPGVIYYVSGGQVNIQAPWELQGQTSAQVKVTLYGDLIGNVVTVPIADASPVFFTYGANIAIAQDPGNNYQLISTSSPAKRGQPIVLYANGLGAVNRQPNTGVPAVDASTSTKQTPTVTIGGQSATVQFSGLVPGTVGLYQINVVVPTGATTGSAVPISLSIGGATTPAATLPVQ